MTKERLRRYRDLKNEYRQIIEKLETIEAVLLHPKAQRFTDMPKGPGGGSTMEDLAVKHMELQQRYTEKLDELAAEQLAIEKAIEPLEPIARTLMRYRYIDGLTWEEVCVRINYSWRQTHNIHSRALKN